MEPMDVEKEIGTDSHCARGGGDAAIVFFY